MLAIPKSSNQLDLVDYISVDSGVDDEFVQSQHQLRMKRQLRPPFGRPPINRPILIDSSIEAADAAVSGLICPGTIDKVNKIEAAISPACGGCDPVASLQPVGVLKRINYRVCD
ncbi:Hypothetical predicted protein [Cloeon dipterum]|uniref:Uncharacterized protein n=1 Tax=Cloeon dipterum TaxID=197152 RepID=A0A8S1BVH7_9INSE|nr:Hypothetical predicted protein [Cloeon dipterum]